MEEWWKDIQVGMDADSVLLMVSRAGKKHVKIATVTEVGKCPLGIPTYKIIWHYPGVDFVLEYIDKGMSVFGKLRVYALTEIIPTGGDNGDDASVIDDAE